MVNEEKSLSLRELREARGLTLNDVFQATKITVANLEAMESENYQNLPPPIYTHAYIKAYARMLNIEETQFIRRYEEYLKVVAKTGECESEETELGNSSTIKKIVIVSSFFVFLCILGLFIYGQASFRSADIFSDCFFVRKTQVERQVSSKENVSPGLAEIKAQDETEKKSAEKNTRTEVKQRDEMKSSVGSLRNDEPQNVVPVSEQKTTPSSDRLIISAHEKTWLRITEDNNKPYQILMNPGEKIERFAPNFNIDVGNAGGITLEFQGSQMKNLGKSGEVVHLRLPQ